MFQKPVNFYVFIIDYEKLKNIWILKNQAI